MKREQYSSASDTRGEHNAQTKLLVSVAVAGMVCAMAGGCDTQRNTSASTQQVASEKHVCRGMNTCKGLGGCKTSESGCAGKNTCKGHGGCATGAKASPPAKYTVVRTFYGTDRARTDSADGKTHFGSGRGELSYGNCDVSIPRGHHMGEIERPTSILGFTFPENPERHVMVLQMDVLAKDPFFEQVAKQVNQSAGKKAAVFVHGYNVTFDEAARRTAQMAYDLGFDGAPLFYSWPSQGEELGYPTDETNVEWTQPHLTAFLAEVRARTGAQSIYLIAHSMGNRALTHCFMDLVKSEQYSSGAKVRSLVLAAPDIDADVFRRDIAPALVSSHVPVTLYVSSKDLALQASKKFHTFVRAGDLAGALPALDGVDTIDASAVDTSFLGHSYIGDKSILTDLFYVINDGFAPAQRACLTKAATGDHWEFRP
jgi:esterase/lipase superfamily enzyme